MVKSNVIFWIVEVRRLTNTKWIAWLPRLDYVGGNYLSQQAHLAIVVAYKITYQLSYNVASNYFYQNFVVKKQILLLFVFFYRTSAV